MSPMKPADTRGATVFVSSSCATSLLRGSKLITNGLAPPDRALASAPPTRS